MKTYIALLRGINVGGQKAIKMELLREILQAPDFKNISTYIQSGNIIFDSAAADEKHLENQIAIAILAHFNFKVPVTVNTPEYLEKVIAGNPYKKENLADGTQPYVAFLSDIPATENLAKLQATDFSPDEFISEDRVLYIYYGGSAGKTKLTNAVIESKLKMTSTSRNWKTVLKLYELAMLRRT